ncbi:MAG: hypothetical protein WD232_04025 [Acidimicrobiales bacterium]
MAPPLAHLVLDEGEGGERRQRPAEQARRAHVSCPDVRRPTIGSRLRVPSSRGKELDALDERSGCYGAAVGGATLFELRELAVRELLAEGPRRLEEVFAELDDEGLLEDGRRRAAGPLRPGRRGRRPAEAGGPRLAGRGDGGRAPGRRPGC